MVTEIPRASVGLMSVEEAAAARGWAARSVQNWIKAGLLPVVIAGGGMRTVYLLRAKDVEAFTPPPRGRPAKAAAPKPKPAKKAAPKPRGKGKKA